MKRYYVAPVGSLDDIPGEFHFVDLGSHGSSGAGYHAVVLVSEHVEPPDTWVPLPHLLDAKTNMSKHKHVSHLADVGILPSDDALTTAQKLGAIHKKFAP